MASINKVILLGNLGADPEMRYTAGGDAVASISIATSSSWNDKQSGEKREKTEWHRVVFFRRLAEVFFCFLTLDEYKVDGQQEPSQEMQSQEPPTFDDEIPF